MKPIHEAIKNNKVSVLMTEAYQNNKVEEIFPLLTHTVNAKQNPKYHEHDVYQHHIAVILATENHHPSHPILLPAGVTHDNGKNREGIRKTNKEGQLSDIGHEVAGIPFAKEYLEKEGFDPEIIRKVLFLTEYHGIHFTNDTDHDAQTEVNSVKEKTIKKALKKVKSASKDEEDYYDNLWLLFEFKKMDALGFNSQNGFAQKQYRICELMYPKYMEVAPSVWETE